MLLIAECCSLFGVRCLSFWCLLVVGWCVVCSSLFVVRCSLCVVWCSAFVVCCWWCDAWCWLHVACCRGLACDVCCFVCAVVCICGLLDSFLVVVCLLVAC